MQPRCLTWKQTVRGLATLAIVAACVARGFAGPPDKNDAPQALPEEIVKAWRKAGTQVWMRLDNGWLRTVPEKERVAGDLPAFRCAAWKEGLLAGLPDPGRAFGLDLGHSHMTDAGLKELAALKSLQALNLRQTEVTDAGLKELAGLKSLQMLDLGFNNVTDAAAKELAEFKSLRTLSLGGTPVTGAGLKELAALKNLQMLNLAGAKVTDAGLKELAGLKSLQTLYLLRTPVTDAGLKELQQALPGCKISR